MGTALAQQNPSVELDEPHDLPGCHQYSLVAIHFKCLASKQDGARLNDIRDTFTWFVTALCLAPARFPGQAQ